MCGLCCKSQLERWGWGGGSCGFVVVVEEREKEKLSLDQQMLSQRKAVLAQRYHILPFISGEKGDREQFGRERGKWVILWYTMYD